MAGVTRGAGVLFVFVAGSLAGCTSLLGDFASEPDASTVVPGTDGAPATRAEDAASASLDASGRADAAAEASTASACPDNQLTCRSGCLSPDDVHSCGTCNNDCTLPPHVSPDGTGCR